MDGQAEQVQGEDREGVEPLTGVSAKLSERVFMRSSLGTGRTYVSGLAIEAVVPEVFADNVKKRCQEVSPRAQALLEQLFFVGGDSNYTALLPACDHPGKRLRTWQCFYELEMDAAETYVSRFFGNTDFYPVKGFPRIRRDDDVVIIGSQVSNSSARALLGEVQQREPVFHIAHGEWRTDLHWNLVTPKSAPRTTIVEFRGRRESRAHVIYERDTLTPHASRVDPDKTRYLDDYLLVTTLPVTKGERQRVLIFSGLHGAGNRAVCLILREPPIDLLERAARQIAGAPFFQILLRVETVPDRRGESVPRDLELIGARPLTVE
jgi:hypothetical protein